MHGPNRIRIHPCFHLREFECRGKNPAACDCNGAVIIHSAFLERLIKFRESLDTPVRLIRGFSCPGYNNSIGGADYSKHISGMAIDWDVFSAGYTEHEAAKLATDTKLFTGIGIYGRSYRDDKTEDIVLVRGYKNMRGAIHLEYCPVEDSRRDNGVLGPTELFRNWGD